jgi:hypothetical protein
MYASNIVLFAIGALTASASPLLQQRSSYTACPSGMYENLQCCKTNVVGIAAFQCKAPSKEPASLDEFKSLCGAPAVSALCCTLPLVCYTNNPETHLRPNKCITDKLHRPVRMLCVWTLSLICLPCRPWEDQAHPAHPVCPPWDLAPLAPLVCPPPARASLSRAVASFIQSRVSFKARRF